MLKLITSADGCLCHGSVTDRAVENTSSRSTELISVCEVWQSWCYDRPLCTVCGFANDESLASPDRDIQNSLILDGQLARHAFGEVLT